MAAERAPDAPREENWTVPKQPLGLTLFKATGVVLATLLLAGLALRIAIALGGGTSFWLALPALVVGYLLADVLSGTAHWFCDTFFDVDTPIIGRTVIFPFRDHHDHPRRILQYRFIDQDTTNFFLLLPFLALTHYLEAPAVGDAAALAWAGGLLGLALGSFFTNLCHKWAHMAEPPAVVRGLQRAGLILSPRRHRHHHRDHSRAFCVTSGWMNPLLDRLRFFPRIERLIRSLQR